MNQDTQTQLAAAQTKLAPDRIDDTSPAQDSTRAIAVAEITKPSQTKLATNLATFQVDEALRLRLNKQWTYQEIGDKYGISRQAVEQRLSRFAKLLDDPELTTAYRNNQAELIDTVLAKLTVAAVDKIDDPKSSLNNIGYTYTQFFNATRLLRNESTANYNQLTKVIQDSEGLHKKAAAEEIIQVKPVDNL